MTEEVQGREAPVDAVQTKMLRQPVLEFVSSLSVNECQRAEEGLRSILTVSRLLM